MNGVSWFFGCHWRFHALRYQGTYILTDEKLGSLSCRDLIYFPNVTQNKIQEKIKGDRCRHQAFTRVQINMAAKTSGKSVLSRSTQLKSIVPERLCWCLYLVLPNFAMTDYAAQGHTRPDNVVELNNCRNHQSYYTCLSRSATAEGTIIIQGFDSTKITGGAYGNLRQEFHQLEMLDAITKMKYDGTLPVNIDGH